METIEEAKTIKFFSDENSEYQIRKKPIFKENYRPFGMIGKYNRRETRKKQKDIFDLILSVPNTTGRLFNLIKENSSQDLGIAVMSGFAKYPQSKMGTTYRRLVKLREINLVKKVIPFEFPEDKLIKLKSNPAIPETHTYMINPDYLKPWKITLAKEIWKIISQKGELK